jgi:hypothetical protein
MPRIDTLLAADGSVFGNLVPPILPESPRSWLPGRCIASPGAPLRDEADESALWKLRMGSAMPDLDAALDRALASLPPASTLCLRPAADSVLSDVPTTLGLLRRFESRVELLLAPADLIAPAMLPHSSDHLIRILSAFESHPAVRGIILEDLSGPGEFAPAGTGLIKEPAWRHAMTTVRRSAWPLIIDRHNRADWLLGLT